MEGGVLFKNCFQTDNAATLEIAESAACNVVIQSESFGNSNSFAESIC